MYKLCVKTALLSTNKKLFLIKKTNKEKRVLVRYPFAHFSAVVSSFLYLQMSALVSYARRLSVRRSSTFVLVNAARFALVSICHFFKTQIHWSMLFAFINT